VQSRKKARVGPVQSGASTARTSSDPLNLPDAIGPRKRFWFRVTAISSPVIFLLTLEAALRLAHWGYPTSFFLRKQQGGQTVLVDNPKFGWRFFPREVARTPEPFSIPAKKPASSVRIFLFGESAAMGDPDPSYGFGRQLERILQARHPGQAIEVINVAMTAINSHVIREIAKNCAPLQGDYWLIFAGNNEVVGPFGAGTVFGRQAPPLRVVRFNLAFRKTRVGQLLAWLARDSREPKTWRGMELFLGQQVARGDARLRQVYQSFEHNLNDIAEIGRHSGAQVLFSTVPVNLRTSPPFASMHRHGLTEAELQDWNQSFAAGQQARAEGRFTEALTAYARATRIDTDYAELAFVRAQAEAALGQSSAAEKDFSLARDLDGLRFRADSQINRSVREVAAHYQAPLVDAETDFAQSPQAAVLDEHFYDHVHLNFAGSYRMASLFATAIEKNWPGTPASSGDRLSRGETARRLAFTDFDQHRVGEEMRARLQQPPFSSQSNFQQRDQQWREALAHFHPDTNALVSVYRSAVGLSSNDWILRANFARVLEFGGDRAGASTQWTSVSQLLPDSARPWFNLGRLADSMGDRPKAEALLRRALEREPGSVEIITELGVLLAEQGETNQAMQQYRAALRLQPGFSAARVNLGVLFAQSGDAAGAKIEYQQTLKRDAENVDARINLANLLSKEGQDAAARALYEEALKLPAGNPMAQFKLGRWLMANNRAAEAIPHFEAMVQARPDQAEAHYELGHALAQTGNNAAALDQFAEAVRLDPALVEAHLNYGVALAKAQRYAEAAAEFRETLRLAPDHRLAARMLENATRAMNRVPAP
jgi:tetratricopeptide (TPR) repeat protein